MVSSLIKHIATNPQTTEFNVRNEKLKMNNWPDQLKLFVILSTIKVLLETESDNDGWSFESPKESLTIIDQTIAFFQNPDKNSYPENIDMQFGPTGPLQEISISNGWSEVFLKLAEQYDKCSYCLEEKRK